MYRREFAYPFSRITISAIGGLVLGSIALIGLLTPIVERFSRRQKYPRRRHMLSSDLVGGYLKLRMDLDHRKRIPTTVLVKGLPQGTFFAIVAAACRNTLTRSFLIGSQTGLASSKR